MLTLISQRSVIILSSHLGLGLPKGPFPELLPSSILATHLNLLDIIILSEVNGINYAVPHCKAIVNIGLRILFSNIRSLHSSLNVRDHAQLPYSTTGNIIVLYILISKFLERSLGDKSVWTE